MRPDVLWAGEPVHRESLLRCHEALGACRVLIVAGMQLYWLAPSWPWLLLAGFLGCCLGIVIASMCAMAKCASCTIDRRLE